MKAAYLRYYDRYTWRAGVRFTLDALLTPSRLRRLSLSNRQRDYVGLGGRPDLMALHRRLNAHLLAARASWPSYDYGEGYFYQSMAPVGITGLRDTAARVEGMGLRPLLAGRRVLEIGCNCGFVALSCADVAARIDAFDINPSLIAVAGEVAAHLGADRARFETSSFESYAAAGTWDVVLSFANHTTYDGNTRQTVEDYFRKCRDLVAPGGRLLFESHAPAYEGEGLQGVCEIIARLFRIRERRVLSAGTFLDRGRTFIVAERPG
jgi:SAM-dependent methyltransferase